MNAIAHRTIAWMLGLGTALLVFGAIASTTRNLTIDFRDRYLLRLYAGGIWFIHNDRFPHGKPGSEIYLNRADYSEAALVWSVSKTGARNTNYREHGMPTLWLAAPCAVLWLFVMRRDLLDRRRRLSLALRFFCIAVGVCVTLALSSVLWTMSLDCFFCTFRESAGALSLDRQPDNGSRLEWNTSRVDWSGVSLSVLVPWFERHPAAAAAGTGSTTSGRYNGISYRRGLPILAPTSPGWAASLPLVVPGGVFGLCAFRTWKRMRRLAGNCCPKCFYDFAGLPAGVRCPECGSLSETATAQSS